MAIELTGNPNLTGLYLKAAVTTPARRGGDLPDTVYTRPDIEVDREHLAEYNRVCGFGLRDELPPTYPHMLSFGMQVRLMTDSGFPFALPGLVHIANTIRQQRPLLVTETVSQRVWAEGLRAHPKGQCFDVITETSVEDSVVWWESSTYLRRGASDDSVAHGEPVTDINGDHPTAQWRLPGDLGRRYAAVSGDRNPIHLHPLTAKAFGFPRAIAHGMWSKARCLAAFEGRLPGACEIRVEFRKPVLLPSTVAFTERGTQFALHSRSGKPHLLGAFDKMS